MQNDFTYSDQLNAGCSDDCPTSSEHPTANLYPRFVTIRGQTADDLNTCKWATSVAEENRLTGTYRLRGITCKRWGCPSCARTKIRELAQWTKLACPNKLLTLTINPECHDNPELAWKTTAPKIPELIRELRKRFGLVEYLRVVEQTQNGWPHYHMLLRSSYLPQPAVKKLWQQLTGAKIVDIRQVSQFFNSFQYLVKYLTKLHHVEWTDRHVTYSRGFFPVSITPTVEPSEWRTIQQIACEPHTWLDEQYPGETLVQTAPLTYVLKRRPNVWLAPHPEEKIKPLTQQDWGF
jgi:hypothetical protein